MDVFQAIVLGLVQGATEFLPISSSGHLALFSALFRWDPPTLAFAVALHMGTLLAVVIYYIGDVWKLILAVVNTFKKRERLDHQDQFYVRLLWMLLVALIPAGTVGLLFADEIGGTLSEPHLVSIFLFVTAFLLVAASWDSGRGLETIDKVSLKHALSVGFLQILALFPGVSRSGSTIAGGIFAGLTREDSARFSFLLSIPTLTAAGLLESKDALTASVSHVSLVVVFCGFITAFIVGFLSIRFFFATIKRTKFYYFAAYCVLVGIVGLVFT